MTSLQAVVLAILLKPEAYEWSYQGFGFIRCYIHDNDEWRLHIWDNNKRVRGVSDIYTHPWDFKYTVVSGSIDNFTFKERLTVGIDYTKQLMEPGNNARLISDKMRVKLQTYHNLYNEGNTYYQKKEEIHQTQAIPGTVTLIQRSNRNSKDRAFVYYNTLEWVAGTPRKATDSEIAHFTHMARLLIARSK